MPPKTVKELIEKVHGSIPLSKDQKDDCIAELLQISFNETIRKGYNPEMMENLYHFLENISELEGILSDGFIYDIKCLLDQAKLK